MGIEKLNELQKTYKKTRNIFLIIALIIEVGFVFFALAIRTYEFIIIGFITLIVFYFIIVGSKKTKFVSAYKITVMPLALQQVMTDTFFAEKYRGILDYVEGRIIRHGNKRSCDDYIKGKYKGVNVELSEFTIQYETTDSDGNTDTTTYFNGVWFVIDFNKVFKNDLLVHGKNYYYTRGFGEKIETEDLEFNKKFKIMSNNNLEAFYILTPSIMEKIKELNSRLKCRLIMFFEDSKLNIGLDGYKNLFEPNVNEEINIDKFKDKILADLGVVFDLIETLDLDNDLFKK